MSELHWPAAGIIAGLCFLVAGGELLVRGASKLAAAMRISPLVIGLTVVAFGTSSPELAVSLQSALAGNADIAIGNVVGSNIANVLFILGSSALMAPLIVSSRLIRWDVPIMVGASILLWVLARDGSLSRLDGIALVGILVAYLVWTVRQSRRASVVVQEEFALEIPSAEASVRSLLSQITLIMVGLGLLGVGSNWLVNGAVAIATHFGVSQLVIGLTIVAVGTSLPELVTSVIAAYRGERDIAVGNVVGSNLLNILCVLGMTCAITSDGVAVSAAALRFDIPIMIVAAVACLPIFFTGNVIARWEGGVFLLYYFAYTAHVLLAASSSQFNRSFTQVMIGFVIPLTLVTLAVSAYRSVRATHRT